MGPPWLATAQGSARVRVAYPAVAEPDVVCEVLARCRRFFSELRDAKSEPRAISYSAGISACDKGEQWQRVRALLSEMREVELEPTVSATVLGSTRARRASDGSGHWRC
ncbi:unnamed protein product [Prorocentrum cordatum]|uniref:Uncharacterized protein n=1 Tax=Prorocentrum cordatum TaxID=2364126 RepID=A0ABN9XKX7_9DINO|nr:unnamed protein product [Polarella glacialis]